MRVCYWSSDVCSSDLCIRRIPGPGLRHHEQLLIRVFVGRESYCYVGKNAERIKDVVARLPLGFGNFAELADLCVRYEISGMRAYFVARGEIRKEEGAERLLVKNTEVIVLDIAVMSELPIRSEEHTSELQSLMRISYAVISWT